MLAILSSPQNVVRALPSYSLHYNTSITIIYAGSVSIYADNPTRLPHLTKLVIAVVVLAHKLRSQFQIASFLPPYLCICLAVGGSVLLYHSKATGGLSSQ